MCPSVIVIVGIVAKGPAKMGFSKHDDVVETFPPDRADRPLHMPVLTR